MKFILGCFRTFCNFVRMTLCKPTRTRYLVTVTWFFVTLYSLKKVQQTFDDNYFTGSESQFDDIELKRDYFIPLNLRKIDWDDHQSLVSDKLITGIPVIHTEVNNIDPNKPYSFNGFNGQLSDTIPLNRFLPEVRHPKCKDRLYLESLPAVSVVITIHNEHETTLLRTIYSVMSRSPQRLIKEVILVDDASTKYHFRRESMFKYLEEKLDKIQVLRFSKWMGMIKARSAGAKRATGDVIVFLNSHLEVTTNWLPPLLEPIALDHRTVVCPFIDVVAYDTFEYRAQDEGARGAFDWEFFYKRLPVLPRDLANMPEPFESPVMAGEVFAISRSYFWELGGYDPGLLLSGGEQFELSFKIWQCGGRIVDVPCSRVGVVSSIPSQYVNMNNKEVAFMNKKRVAEVWMDEYAEHLYKRRPHYRRIDTSDISAQRAVRERLHCKSFHWFMTQVAFDLVQYFPVVEPPPYAEGEIRLSGNERLCVAAIDGNLTVKMCENSRKQKQQFELTFYKDLRLKSEYLCWDLEKPKNYRPITLLPCVYRKPNQLWSYIKDKQHVRHNSGYCLDFNSLSVLHVVKCNDTSVDQRWVFKAVNQSQYHFRG